MTLVRRMQGAAAAPPKLFVQTLHRNAMRYNAMQCNIIPCWNAIHCVTLYTTDKPARHYSDTPLCRLQCTVQILNRSNRTALFRHSTPLQCTIQSTGMQCTVQTLHCMCCATLHWTELHCLGCLYYIDSIAFSVFVVILVDEQACLILHQTCCYATSSFKE